MKILKQIGMTIVELVKQVWRLPQTIADGNEQRRRYNIRAKREAERIDRIRNPSKYLEK